MINTKFVFAVSMVAFMAVGVAHADIAATSYFKGSAPITVDKGTISVAVDSELKPNSTYPVQNKAIHTALSAKEATANKLTSTATTTVTDTNKDTLYPSVGRVQSMINALDVSDSAQSGKYVSAVSETDGKITVTRASLPTVNNATLTIQKNGADVGTFTANASEAKTINITVPTGSLASKSTISNTDVATNAAIAQSKIANLTTDLAGKLANTSTIKNAIVTTDANGAVAPVEIVDSGTGTYVTDVAVSAGKVTLSRGTPSINNATLTIKNGATNGDLATFTANSSAPATATIPAASATVAGLAKIGVIPSGSATSATYASIWVE